MDVRDAVIQAYQNNRKWVSSHSGIVDFILTNQELDEPGNRGCDQAILTFPELARQAAAALDNPTITPVRVTMTLLVPNAAWAEYADDAPAPRPEEVQTWLQNALWVHGEHMQAEVHSVQMKAPADQ